MSEEELTQERTNQVLAEWPTLKQASGCVNCDALFREPTKEGGRCPHCKSKAVFDAAAVLASERVPLSELIRQAHEMIHSLEEAVNDANDVSK